MNGKSWVIKALMIVGGMICLFVGFYVLMFKNFNVWNHFISLVTMLAGIYLIRKSLGLKVS